MQKGCRIIRFFLFVLNANGLSTLRIQCFLQGCCMKASERGNATNLVLGFCYLRDELLRGFCGGHLFILFGFILLGFVWVFVGISVRLVTLGLQNMGLW